MQDSTVTLIVGIAGILGTLTSSAVGHYYIAKVRRDVYQKAVFSEQMAMLKSVHLLVGRARNLLAMIVPPDAEHYDMALQDSLSLVPQIADLIHEGSAFLPQEIWVDLNQFADKLIEVFEISDKNSNEAAALARDVQIYAATLALATRKLFGIDELSVETYNMLTGSQHQYLMSTQERASIAEIAEDVN